MKGKLLLVAAAIWTWNILAAERTTIVVDASSSIGPVNRNLFGHNIEAAGSINNIKYGQGLWNAETRRSNPAIVDAVKKLGIGMMRYPGGCYVHSFDWRQFTGPLAQRGDRQFGIDEFITLCHDLGAEPMITISDYVLPDDEMPAHAAALVEYLNSPATPEHPWAMKRKEWGHPEPYGVKWFELGNESDHGNHGAKCGFAERRYTPEEYVDYAVKTAKAMRQVDPSIKLGVVTRAGAGNDYDCRWNMAVYRDAAPIADYLVVHIYGPGIDGNDPSGNFKSCMAYGEQLTERLTKYRELSRQLGGKDLPLAITEYNVDHNTDKPLPYRFTYTAGLLCADLMRIFHDPSMQIANAEYWHVANGWWGMFDTRGDAIVKRRAALPFFQLWGEHFDGSLLKVEVQNAIRCEAPSTRSLIQSQGKIKIMPEKIADIPLPSFSLNATYATKLPSELISFKIDGINKESYPAITSFTRPESAVNGIAWCYRLNFEARFLTDDSSARNKVSLGVGINDLRGYDKTKSGAGIMGVEKACDWQPFSCLFQTSSDCPGAVLLLKIEDSNNPYTGKIYHPATGTLEVRNLKVELVSPPSYPAYQGLTSTASLSQNGKTLHLIVFNKSYDQTIESAIELKSFAASKAESWTVWQKDVNSLDYAAPVQAMVKMPPQGETLTIKFRPHSMTAIDFKE